MKKTIGIIAMIILLSNITFSQPYKSIFGNTQTSWNVHLQMDEFTLTDSLVVGHDTTLIVGKI